MDRFTGGHPDDDSLYSLGHVRAALPAAAVFELRDSAEAFGVRSINLSLLFRLDDLNPTPLVIRGDLNGDRQVDLSDATLALRAAVGLLNPTSDQLYAATGLPLSGKITAGHALKILRKAIGLTDPT